MAPVQQTQYLKNYLVRYSTSFPPTVHLKTDQWVYNFNSHTGRVAAILDGPAVMDEHEILLEYEERLCPEKTWPCQFIKVFCGQVYNQHGFRKNHNFFFGNNTLLWCCYSVFLSLSYLPIYWTWQGPRGIFYKALTVSIFFSISSFISNHFVIYIEFCVSSPFTCITIHLHNQNLLTISWHLALETHYQQEQICTGGVNTLIRRDINM